MNHGDVHATQFQAVRRFQAKQATADHDGSLVLARSGNHRIDIGDVAEADDAGQIGARHRQDERFRAGGQQQAVVIRARAVVCFDKPVLAVDFHDPFAGMQLDAVFGIPVAAVQHDLFHRLLACQYRRQHDAVVIRMRFVAEHRDVVEVGGRLQQLFQSAHAGHAVAHQNQFHACHVQFLQTKKNGGRPDRERTPLSKIA